MSEFVADHIVFQKIHFDLETNEESASKEIGSAAMKTDVMGNGIDIETSEIIYDVEPPAVPVPSRPEGKLLKVAATEDIKIGMVADSSIEIIDTAKQVTCPSTCGYSPAGKDVEVANVGLENDRTKAPKEKDVNILNQAPKEKERCRHIKSSGRSRKG